MYIPEYLKKIGLLMSQNNEQVYLVGGFIRNGLLNLPVTDIDLAGTAQADTVARILNNQPGYKVVMRAPEFGTVEIHVLDGGSCHICEYTTFRSDSYKGGLHKPSSVTFTRDIALDAFRRDFTVNALYASLITGEITDLVNGLSDIKSHIIRAVKPDANAVFAEDGLRILRLIRFAAQLDWEIDKNTLTAAKNNAALIADISRERILNEMNLILLADTAYPLLSRKSIYFALSLLSSLDAFPYILPNAVLTDNELQLCARVKPILTLRYSALLSSASADTIEDLLGRQGLKASQKLINDCKSLINNFNIDDSDSILTMHRVIAMGRELTEYLIELKRAANKDTLLLESALNRLIDSGLTLGISALKINGDDCLSFNIKGKEIKNTLNMIFDMVLNGSLENDRENLLEFIKSIILDKKSTRC